jgi:feruloyl esterase
MNLADLTRMQRQWSAMLTHTEVDEGRLTEVEGFGSNPGELRMLTYVPPRLPLGAPLVVVLHGCTQTAAGYDAGTGWSQLAEHHGFALLLPEQRRSNNAHTCFNWFEPADTARGEGEVASIRQMVARMVADHRLSTARIHITGLSAGGAMTAAMLATYPEVFAGGAIIAGLPFGAAAGVQQALTAMHHCRSMPAPAWGDLVRAASPLRHAADRPLVSIWHGDADQTVSPGNALEGAKQWADVHGLREADGVEDRVDGVPHRAWRGRDGSVRVELYAVPGLAHGAPITPGAEGDRGVGRAMPYILAAPISSTWHIAKGWGLLGAAGAAVRGRPAASGLLRDPAGIIARGLRAVGLGGG